MPVFHTKTIESILEPVAQQVSRLVILHEEAEDGNAMPDLERPVMAVSRAVTNLVKVGRETINSSEDAILKQDMPAALVRVEGASRLLEEASAMLKADPYSGPARKKLIEGSRGILQGTSALLLCFDESEVRKIIRECKRVLDYLAVAEVIETMEDLVQFLKDLSPCLSKVSREVGGREKELTHQVHREILVRCLEQVKTLAPILICSMKIFIHIIAQGGKGAEEAAENRNYLAQRMTDELNEIIRVLQLTTYDEEEWDADNLTVMKKAQNAIEGKVRAARDWLEV
jgi:vinculin